MTTLKKSLLLFVITVLPALLPDLKIVAQEQQTLKHNLKLAFEFGASYMETELAKPEQIRENRSAGYYYLDEYYNYGFFWEYNPINKMYFGVKPEFFIFNNRIGIASGLRYTMITTKLNSDRDNFLWKVNEDGLNTDYVRIIDIVHKSHLFGLPLEIRYFPNNRELPFQHYFKIGTSFNFHIHSNNKVNFANKTMEKYDDLINSQLSENNLFSSFVFGGIGFKIGKYKEGKWIPWGNIEFHFPYLLLTKDSFTFVGKNDYFPGFGFQTSFQIPIGQNAPIGSIKSLNH